MATNILGCFNCEFFKANGSRPKSHVPGTKYHGVCGNSARPNNSGEMSILMTEERPNASEGCEYHSAAQHRLAADEWGCSPTYHLALVFQGFKVCDVCSSPLAAKA